MSADKINSIFEKNQEAIDIAERKLDQDAPSLVKRAEKHINPIIEKIKEHEEMERYLSKAKELIEEYSGNVHQITFGISREANKLLDEGYDDAILLAYTKALIEINNQNDIEE